MPPDHLLPDRLDAVLAVVYLVFNQGYGPPVRHDLCAEAIRLGGILCVLMPDEPEAHGLYALMQLQHARRDARLDEHGDLVLLDDQDRVLWDSRAIAAGRAALDRALALRRPGPYQLQAAIASLHCEAQRDWQQIALLYGRLATLQPSPVVELNRAVAVGLGVGPAAGLALVDALRGEKALSGYQLLPAVRGDLLAKLGRSGEARAEFEKAASLAGNSREREVLLARASALGPRDRE